MGLAKSYQKQGDGAGANVMRVAHFNQLLPLFVGQVSPGHSRVIHSHYNCRILHLTKILFLVFIYQDTTR